MNYQRLYNKNVILEVITGLFILLFVYTSISKLANISGFTSVLSKSPLLGDYKNIVAWSTPSFELIISALLFFPRTRKIGFHAATLLMLLFTSYLIYIIYFTPELPCSCGGVLNSLSWNEHLVFNSIFISLGVVGTVMSKNNSHHETPNSQVVGSY
jgi:hypothetical protein